MRKAQSNIEKSISTFNGLTMDLFGEFEWNTAYAERITPVIWCNTHKIQFPICQAQQLSCEGDHIKYC